MVAQTVVKAIFLTSLSQVQPRSLPRQGYSVLVNALPWDPKISFNLVVVSLLGRKILHLRFQSK